MNMKNNSVKWYGWEIRDKKDGSLCAACPFCSRDMGAAMRSVNETAGCFNHPVVINVFSIMR